MQGYRSACIDAGGINTHYISAGAGHPLILLHGGGAGSDGYGNWYACLPLFAAHYQVICVDMLGFGNTEKPDPATFIYSQEARTRHLLDFVSSLDIGPVTLVGNSMGGITAIDAAVAEKDRFAGLILLSPAGLREASIPADLLPLLNYDGTPAAIGRMLTALANDTYTPDPALLEYRAAIANRESSRKAQLATLQWIQAQQGLYLSEDRIRQLARRTLLLGGEFDPIVRPGHIYKLAGLIKNSRGHLVKNCAHLMMLEYPALFFSLCRAFIQGV